MNKLIPVLEANPLRTVKYLDYLDFKKILVLLDGTKTIPLSEQDKEYAKRIIQGMNSGRTSTDTPLKLSVKMLPINKFWILGLPFYLNYLNKKEGEGTFGLKILVPYFQVGQHIRSKKVMEEISLYLSKIPNIFAFTLNSPTLKANVTIHKNTNVVVYSYHNIDSLHDYLEYFLLDLSFQTRKGTDFYIDVLSCIYINMDIFI